MKKFQYIPKCTTYVTKKKKNYFGILHLYQVSCTFSLPLLNISNCQSVLNACTILQIVYVCMTAIAPNLSSCTTSLLTGSCVMVKACIVVQFQTVVFGHFLKDSVLVRGVDAETVC